MQEKNLPDVKKILLNLANEINIKNIRGLSRYLEIEESTLYSWIARHSIGDTGAILSKMPRINVEYLKSGKGDIYSDSILVREGNNEFYGPDPGLMPKITGHRPIGAFDIPRSTAKIPMVSWAQAGTDGYFVDSHLTGLGFGEINRPFDVSDPDAYALIISGDSMIPKFEPGDIVVVSPRAGVQTGDYAVVKLVDGQIMAKRVREKNDHFIFESVNPDYDLVECPKEKVVFMHRIVWIKQRG